MNTAIIKPQWGPLTIGLMVLGFILWWPLGLVVLGYIAWGEYFGGSADKARGYMEQGRNFARSCRERSGGFRHGGFSSSGNAAFRPVFSLSRISSKKVWSTGPLAPVSDRVSLVLHHALPITT